LVLAYLLSFIPALQLEDEVSLALRQLGHHLTATTSHLFRAQAASPAELLPGHLQGIHPLLLQEVAPKALAPGLLEKETLGQVRKLGILAGLELAGLTTVCLVIDAYL
jgi:hypothetical protein